MGREKAAAEGGTRQRTSGSGVTREIRDWTGVEEVATGGRAERMGRENNLAEARSAKSRRGRAQRGQQPAASGEERAAGGSPCRPR